MAQKALVFIFMLGMIFSTSMYGLFKARPVDAFDCLSLTSSSAESDKEFCKKELANIEAQLQELLGKQKDQQKQTGTLKGDVNYLTSQINALLAKIKARGLVIAHLKVSIKEKVGKIESLNDKIDREHESLAQLLRNTNEFDNANMVHLVLSDNALSGFYADIESYASIKEAVQASVNTIRGVKTETEEEKKELEKKQNAETDAKADLESAQKKVKQSEADKKQLLAISKNQEATYQALATQKRAQAAKIRAALFPLAGTSQKIEFGTALQYANQAKTKLGIDPAFLLAIITQESNLGANVGQCYLTDPATGVGAGKNTGTVFVNTMKPTRDVQPFLAITKALGLDPFKTPVSCPIAGVAGWGGAMGPAQFIPSTWQIFTSRLKAVLGRDASPWQPEDAFMASAMYLTDLGAYGSSVSGQTIAACKYYGSGGTACSYGLSVQRLRASIQANIDILQNQ